MKKATIVIATRNRTPQLKLGLESIRTQNYRDVDVVIIDDGSTDGTEVLAKMNLDPIRVVRIEREGSYRRNPGYVLNMGHHLAGTDMVIEQGGEVCHLTDCVTPLLEVCRPGMVALARVHHGEPEQMEKVIQDIKNGDYEFPDNFEPETYKTCGDDWPVPRIGKSQTFLYCGKERPVPFLFLGAIHREDFDAVGGYDEARLSGNDEDLANRLIAKGVRFCFVGKAVAFHLKHGKS